MTIAMITIRAVMRKPSKPLTPSAQKTIQTLSPAVMVRIRPIRPEILSERSGECGGQRADDLAHLGGGVARFRRGPHEATADDDPLGSRLRRRGGLLGRGDAESDRDRNLGVGPGPGDDLVQASVET